MKILRWIVSRLLLALMALLTLVLLLVVWVLHTQSGARAAAGIAPHVVPGQLSIGGVQGVLGKAVTVTGLRFSDAAAGIELRLDRATVSFELSELPRGHLHIREATVDGLVLGMKGSTSASPSTKPAPAFDVELDSVTIRRSSVQIGTRVISIDHAQLAGRYADGKLELTHLELVVSGSRLSLTGTLTLGPHSNESLAVTGELRIPSLAVWDRRLRGTLTSRLRATGRWPSIAVDVSAHVQDVEFEDFQIGAAELQATVHIPQNVQGDVRIEARQVGTEEVHFDTVGLTLKGGASKHSLHVRAVSARLESVLRASGAYVGAGWSGVLETVSLSVAGFAPLALRAPARIDISSSRLVLANACLAGQGISACTSGELARDGRMKLVYSIENLPLMLLAKLAMPTSELRIEGSVEGEGDLRRERDGTLAGRAHLAIPTGSVAPGAALTDSAVRLAYHDLALDADLSGDSAHLRLGLMLARRGQVSGQFEITEVRSGKGLLQGQANLTVPELGSLASFLPQLSGLKGSAEIIATARGSVLEPRFTAEAHVRELSGELPVFGLMLREGSLSAILQPDHTATVSGRITSGEGVLQLEGSATTSAIHLSAQGRNVLAADVPGARIIVSPQLKLDGSLREPALTGTLEIPMASVDVSKLTRSGGQRASPDVVVVDRKHAVARPAAALNTDITLTLGDEVKLAGFGLDAHLTGQLRVREKPGEATTGSGELRLAGNYEAYGRKLTIERGKLQFAGTSLENPELDIIAVRKVKEVTAKLHVSGTAQRPQLSVSAEPAMSSTDALSYLVAGKPLDEFREEEGTLFDSAAESLGGMLGDKIARRLAARFGIDSAGVEQNAELGSALTLGKYLSPQLFVSYGIGLFEPGHTMTLRYKMSEHWSLEADQAPEDQRAGVRYRIEK